MTGFKKEKGFAILYAVLVVGIVSVTSLLIADILTRQIIISSINRNYQYAYYIAHSGKECAQTNWTYWGFFMDENLDSVACGTAFIPINNISTSGSVHTSIFRISEDNLCADVTVIYDESVPTINIKSVGYNMDCDASNSRKVRAFSRFKG